MKYNYVYFNASDGQRGYDGKRVDGYNAICLKDLEGLENVRVVSMPCELLLKPIRIIYAVHNSARINKYVNIPLKKIWYKYYFNNNFYNNKPICFVFSHPNIPINYIQYLRKRYRGCKCVRIFRDLVSVGCKQNPEYTVEKCQKVFDLCMSFDKEEARKYGFVYFNEIESKIDVKPSIDYPMVDVFFAGKAKDRLKRLIDAYEVFSSNNISCFYYLTGVPKQERVLKPGIEYADKLMPYYEMLQRTINSKCLLEIYQGGAVGYTSRFLEAVLYNKKLITENISIMQSKYYDQRFIQCIDSVNCIDPAFIKSDITVNYNYEGDFSPIHLINQIDAIL